MTCKLVYALGLFIGTSVAVWVGFNSLADPLTNPNSDYSLIMLACLYSIVPALLKFVAMPLLWNYPLTEERVAELQKEIEVNKQAAAAKS